MDYFKIRKCKVSGFEWKQFNSLQKCPCNECVKEREVNKKPPVFKPKTAIKKVSDKRKKEQPIYDLKKILFFRNPENKHCIIQGTYCTGIATTIEHSMGRKGFADQWARDNNISLFIDERFFKPSCNNCNLELENNPELNRKHQLSKIHGGTKINKSRE